jgi:hypothetical protein
MALFCLPAIFLRSCHPQSPCSLRGEGSAFNVRNALTRELQQSPVEYGTLQSPLPIQQGTLGGVGLSATTGYRLHATDCLDKQLVFLLRALPRAFWLSSPGTQHIQSDLDACTNAVAFCTGPRKVRRTCVPASSTASSVPERIRSARTSCPRNRSEASVNTLSIFCAWARAR